MTLCCPECNYEMEITDEDSRQEWSETVYYCKVCNKTFLRRTEYQTQSSLVESDKLTEIDEKDL
jgi:transposase-like protein